jgi:hypothetical protein
METIDDQKADRLTSFHTVDGLFDSISKINKSTSVPHYASDPDIFRTYVFPDSLIECYGAVRGISLCSVPPPSSSIN